MNNSATPTNLKDAIETFGSAFEGFYNLLATSTDVDDAILEFEARSRGVHASLKVYAVEFLDTAGAFDNMPSLVDYMDWDKVITDLDIDSIPVKGGLHVFAID